MQERFRSFVNFWIPPLLWALCIFVLSSLSQPPQPGRWDIPLADKWAHMLAFGGLAYLLFRAIRGSLALPLLSAAVVALLATSAYGALDEFHQAFVPEREVEFLDWVADTVGAATVLFCTVVLQRNRSRAST